MGFDGSRSNSPIAGHLRRDTGKREGGDGVPVFYTARPQTVAAEADFSPELVGSNNAAVRAVKNNHPRSGLQEGDRIAIIESRIFLRECIRQRDAIVFSIPLDTYESIAELEKDNRLSATRLVVVSWTSEGLGGR